MFRFASAGFVVLAIVSFGFGQVDQLPSTPNGPGPSQAPPRYDHSGGPGESSSRDTRIDISPPKDDAKNHPGSSPGADDANISEDVQELHPWDPHKALKDIEIGDFYFRRKNYRAALDRYREALFYKSGDAVANFRMAESMEKLGDSDGAVEHYQQYLKILPHGPFSSQAEKALQKLKDEKQSSEKLQSKG